MARRYAGPLSLDEISVGISACIDNIKALTEDADILISTGRAARALNCLLVADQENGKVSVLYWMPAIDPSDKKQWQVQWKWFRSHQSKAAAAFTGAVQPYLADSEIGQFALFANLQVGPAAEEERQRTLYVDFEEGNRGWSSPLNIPAAFVKRFRAIVQESLHRRLVERERGLYSPKALEIRREVFWPGIHPIDSQGTDPHALAAQLAQEARIRNERFTERLAQEGFDVSPICV
jgi:AbiV family abortive infection protein